MITVLQGSIEAEQASGAAAVEQVEVAGASGAKITGRQPAEAGDRPELTEASWSFGWSWCGLVRELP